MALQWYIASSHLANNAKKRDLKFEQTTTAWNEYSTVTIQMKM